MSVALVTGASTGIGAATAVRLSREPGTELVLVARREELLRELAESLPCRATYLSVDLTAADAPERVRTHLEAEHGGRLDLLVNNAGAAWRGDFAETGYAHVQRHMELNFDAVLRLTESLCRCCGPPPPARSSTSPAPPAGSPAPAPAPTRPASLP